MFSLLLLQIHKHGAVIIKAMRFLENKVRSLNGDPYNLAIVTYALVVSNSSKATYAMRKLNVIARHGGIFLFHKIH